MQPESAAPTLMAFVDLPDEKHCYFKRQPITPEETEEAISAVAVSCCGSVRYCGSDQSVIKKLSDLGCAEACDSI